MKTLETLTKSEKSTLLYLESCMVDGKGKAMWDKMNDEDTENIIDFIRDDLMTVQNPRPSYHIASIFPSNQYMQITHFSDEAWSLAHQVRRERSDRMIYMYDGYKPKQGELK